MEQKKIKWVKIVLDKDLLYNKYVIEKKSIRTISKELNCSTHIVHTNLKEYELNRNHSEAKKIVLERDGHHTSFELDINIIKKLYLEEKLSSNEVAKKLNCSRSKVLKTLNEHNLTRSVSECLVGRIPWNKGKTKHTDDRLRECGVKISKTNKGNMMGYWTDKIRDLETNNKISKAHMGKKISENTKIKMRKSAIDRIQQSLKNNNQIFPTYNKKSIFFIEKYGKENGFNFKHAENGGEFYIKELGYWVDAYDRNKNVVLEFDEKFHAKQKDKDNNRQLEIINYLKCDFIRLNENGGEILNIKYKNGN